MGQLLLFAFLFLLLLQYLSIKQRRRGQVEGNILEKYMYDPD